VSPPEVRYSEDSGARFSRHEKNGWSEIEEEKSISNHSNKQFPNAKSNDTGNGRSEERESVGRRSKCLGSEVFGPCT
jgi:hypothetical protein